MIDICWHCPSPLSEHMPHGQATVGDCLGAGLFRAVYLERIRQRAKWGIQRRSLFTWFLIELEEIGEVARALLEVYLYKDADCTVVDVKVEAIQVLAVGVAFVQEWRPWHGIFGIR